MDIYTFKCKQCGKESESEGKKKIFCSAKCYAKFQKPRYYPSKTNPDVILDITL